MNNDWQNREFNLILLALAAGAGAAFIAVRFLRLNFMLGIVIFLIVFFLIFDKTSAQNKSLVKVYQASLNDSILVVQNVLAEKGIPYRKSGADRFLLERDGVEISLKHVQRRYGGDPRTVLKLIPHNAESWPLIFSLRDKLDDAFRPRGLNS
ncbi:MAG: hypothetical protein WAS33_01500 [Candidatus Promineifilaceae bacterium]|nr:hypothetical protein [Anaerolineaceae bacterium]